MSAATIRKRIEKLEDKLAEETSVEQNMRLSWLEATIEAAARTGEKQWLGTVMTSEDQVTVFVVPE